ncbi:hypothetical protein LTR62_000585 [Meristemomyces frigidus]|uniref:Sexual development protein n=1 Tax=Meristemomyces frigidus TaxID=1508187 RepID=A0AAN7T945_9PEZI|nr:hypothetical protein LTR62_000585 [Meristemomyces frigidus]
MRNSITAAALLGAAAVSAVPQWGGPPGGDHPWPPHSRPSSTASAPSAGQTPFSFPLSDGFPTVTPALLENIAEAAHGLIPNGGLASQLAAGSVTIFELIAFNEIFEVAFFTSLLNNVTTNVPGFEIPSQTLRNYIINTLTAVVAQEKTHYLGVNGILNASSNAGIIPCEYVFPTSDLDSATNLARTFTDVVLGTLQDAQAGLAANGDAEYIPLIASAVGQEGEQNGYYRSLLNLIPSAAPFLTRSAAQFAFSALNQLFIVPGSCPGPANAALFKAIPIFSPLTVTTANIALKDQPISFSISSNATESEIASYSVVFVNQQNVPFVASITNVKISGDVVTFDAFYPAATLIADALTIAAVTSSKGPFGSVPAVAAATLFGPGLIEIN